MSVLATTADRVFIHGLQIETIIGLYDWEREQKQPLIIDIDMLTDLSAAIATDNLSKNIDYAEVAKDIEQIASNHQFLLLEPLAESIAQHILSSYPVSQVTIKINKPQAIEKAKSTGICITRLKKHLIFVSIGSNVNRKKNIDSSLQHLEKTFSNVKLSPTYETQSVGFDGQDFYNLVASFETKLSAEQINLVLKKIERSHGREHKDSKFSDRTLDIDLLLFDDCILFEQGFNVPRDEILSYAFVLKPLADLVPDMPHPEVNRSFSQLWNDFKDKPQLTLIS